MSWTQTTTPKDDEHTKYISMFRNGNKYISLSIDGGEIYNVHSRTHYKTDAFIQMHNIKRGSLKIGSRNFKSLKSAEKYLYKWIAENP